MQPCRKRFAGLSQAISPPRLLFASAGAPSWKRLFHLAAWPEIMMPENGRAGAWRLAEHAAWYDCGDCREGEMDPGRWDTLLTTLRGRQRRDNVLSGAVLVLDAAFLLKAEHWEIRERAALVRERLLRVGEGSGMPLPVHLLLDGMDVLYGMRSLCAFLPNGRLAEPLGFFRTGAAGETPAAFAGEAVEKAVAFARGVMEQGRTRRVTRPGGCAAFQAADEIARLRQPLACFCDEAFAEGFVAPLPWLRSVFFGASGSGGEVLPSMLAAFSSFVPEEEPPPPNLPWFWTETLRQTIPADSARLRQETAALRPNAARSRGGVVALLLGALLVNGLMAAAFCETRAVLLAARDWLKGPDRVGALLTATEETSRRNAAWRLPRFGMEEAALLEDAMRRRFLDAYYQKRIVPGVDRVQEMALEAAASQRPEQIGGALALLIRLRRALTRDGDGGTPAQMPGAVNAMNAANVERVLDAIPDASGLVDAEAMRQLRAYRAWAGPQDWTKAVGERFAEFERYIVETAMAGDPLRWLPEWLESLPALQSTTTSLVQSDKISAVSSPSLALASTSMPTTMPAWNAPAAWSRVGAAWTGEGYAVARALLEAAGEGAAGTEGERWSARRETFLTAYRRRATMAWRNALEEMQHSEVMNVRDDQVRELLRQTLRGEDFPAQFAALLRQRLEPLYPAGSDDPALVWLRLFETETNAGTNDAEMSATTNPVANPTSNSVSNSTPNPTPHPAPNLAASAAAEIRRWRKAMTAALALPDSLARNLRAVRLAFRAGGGADGAFLPLIPEEEDFGNPLAELLAAADALETRLRQHGGGDWAILGPSATARRIRFLAVRLAALSLDALWRERMHVAAYRRDDAATPGEGEALKRFLEEASGLWRLEKGRLAAAAWDGAAFPFNRAFLDYCDAVLVGSGKANAERTGFPISLNRVDVNAGARQFPEMLELLWWSGVDRTIVTYRNSSVRDELFWTPGKELRVGLRVTFPSRSFEFMARGEAETAQLLRRFSSGGRFGPADFPGDGEGLAALGVREIVVHTSFTNASKLAERLEALSCSVPDSIIAPLIPLMPQPLKPVTPPPRSPLPALLSPVSPLLSPSSPSQRQPDSPEPSLRKAPRRWS